MQDFTFDETNLMCIYNGGNRELLIQVLTEMRGHLTPEEKELRELTDHTLASLFPLEYGGGAWENESHAFKRPHRPVVG